MLSNPVDAPSILSGLTIHGLLLDIQGQIYLIPCLVHHSTVGLLLLGTFESILTSILNLQGESLYRGSSQEMRYVDSWILYGIEGEEDELDKI